VPGTGYAILAGLAGLAGQRVSHDFAGAADMAAKQPSGTLGVTCSQRGENLPMLADRFIPSPARRQRKEARALDPR
jgi:hypothetical protein